LVKLGIGAPDINACNHDGQHNDSKTNRNTQGHDAITHALCKQFLVESNNADVTVVSHQHDDGEHPAQPQPGLDQMLIARIGRNPTYKRVLHSLSPHCSERLVLLAYLIEPAQPKKG